jgi:nucleoid DNA-binding protein
MATAKKAVKKLAAKKPAKAAPVSKVVADTNIKPIKTALTKSSLVTHLSEQSGSEPKVVKAILTALEKTVLGSVAKKGLGEFTLPGLLKIGVQKVEAKKRRKGIDPFTKIERWFEAKPATRAYQGSRAQKAQGRGALVPVRQFEPGHEKERSRVWAW